MLDLVAGPVLSPADAAAVVVRQHTGPHEVRPGGVVVGLGNGLGRGGQNGLEQGVAQPVGEIHVRGVGEVAFADVGDHVRRAAGGLIGRQGAGIAGVEDGELGPDHVGLGAAPLEVAFLQGNDAAVAALTAGGGDGQHGAHGQGALNLGLAGEEVPEVPVIGHAEADGLGGIDDGAAAHGQEEVHILPAADLDALVDLAAAGVGLNAGELEVGNALGLQRGGHGVIGAVALDGAAAVNQQHPAAAEAFDESAGVLLLTVTEGKERGGVEYEPIHVQNPSF